jgi:hypothetical protein
VSGKFYFEVWGLQVFALQKLDFFFSKVETDGFGGNQDGATGGAGVNEVHSRSHVCCSFYDCSTNRHI